MGLGDSITANGYSISGTTAQDLSTGKLGSILDQNWIMWACLISGGKLRYGGLSAEGAKTSAQLLTERLPLILTQRPQFCSILCGVNDILAAMTVQQTADNIEAMVVSMLSYGVTPILNSLTGVKSLSGTTSSAYEQRSMKIRRLAEEYKLVFNDMYSLFVDKTGVVPAGSTSYADSTHPNGRGAKSMGTLLSANVLAAYPNLPGPNLPAFQIDSNDENVVPNCLFEAGSGTPTGWTKGGTGSTCTNSAGGGAIIGSVAELTRGSADATLESAALFTANKRYLLTVRLGATVEAMSGKWCFNITDPSYGSSRAMQIQDWSYDLPAGCILECEVGIPTGFPTQSCRLEAKTTSTSKASMAQFSMVDQANYGNLGQ